MQSVSLSRRQRRLWELAGGNLDEPYFVKGWVSVTGAVDRPALERSLAAVIDRHAILRASIQRVSGMALPVMGIGNSAPPVSWSLNRIAAGYEISIRMPAVYGDAWTLDVIARDLARCYDEESVGATSTRPMPPQYLEIACWMDEALSSEEAAPGAAYWQSLDYTLLAEMRLPFDHDWDTPFAPASVPVDIGRAEMQPNDMLACWAGFVARVTGSERALLGVEFAGRPYEEMREVAGPLASYLPVMVDMPQSGFDELRSSLRARLGQAADWQECFDFSFVEPAQIGNPPYFPICFAADEPWKVHVGGGAQFRARCSHHCADRFRWKLEHAGEAVTLHYDAARASEKAAACMARQFAVFAQAALADPSRKFDNLPLLGSPERTQLLVKFNAGGRKLPEMPALAEAVANFAAEQDDAPAVQFEDRVIPYVELWDKAARIAAALAEQGIGPERIAGLCLSRSTDLLAGLLGISAAGGAWLPIDPLLPVERRIALLRQSGAAAVLTSQEWLDGFREAGVPALCMEAIHASGSVSGELRVPDPRQLAYVLFTSGSTGQPKGVAVEHRHLAAYAAAILHELRVPRGSRFALVSTIGADLGYTSVFSSILSGGCLDILSHDRAADPALLAEHLERYPADVLKIVPSHLAALLNCPSADRILPRRVLVLGGEQASWELIGRVRELAPQCRIINHYGPTETTIGALSVDLASVDAKWQDKPPLGRPLRHARAYVLDENLEPAPEGFPGELYLGGDGVTRGYRGMPGITAASFIPDPFSTRPGGRLYRTGDRARFLPDGVLEFLGRCDDQVKIRGHRVELGEIEAALKRHPAVHDAAVVTREETGMQLAAFVVPDRERAAGVAQWLRMEREGRHIYRHSTGLPIASLNRRETEYSVREIFEHAVYARHGLAIRDGDVIFDVGANIGLFSLWAALQARNVAIFAFEPTPRIYELLQRNAELCPSKVTPLCCALGESQTTAEFTWYPGLSLLSGRFPDDARNRAAVAAFERYGSDGEIDADALSSILDERLRPETVKCSVTTLSRAIAAHRVERIDLLKIDAQGSELLVLQGIDPEDWRKIHQIVVEVHDESGRLRTIVQLLETHGFRISVEQDDALRATAQFNVYASRADRAAAPKPDWQMWMNPQEFTASCRAHLQGVLPDYMVPARIVPVERLPLNSNGKIDRRCLREMEPQDTQPARGGEPRDEFEKTLAVICQGLLRNEKFGIHDNFFESGGDSILAIQVVTRAQQNGVNLTVRHVFDHPTITEMAAAARQTAESRPVHEPARGSAPLTPIQRWFLESGFPEPGQHVQTVVLQVDPQVPPTFVREAFKHMASHHDVLRSRFPAESGEQLYADDAHLPFLQLSAQSIDDALRSLPPLDLEEGPVAGAVWVDGGDGGSARLIIRLHRLVVDTVSWRILLDDLGLLYKQYRSGVPLALPPRSSSYQEWAREIIAFANSEELKSQAPFWLEKVDESGPDLPEDFPGGSNRLSTARHVLVNLEAEETQSLLTRSNGARVDEWLLAALALALTQHFGTDEVRIDVESHGRETIAPSIDLLRTVGWFTSLYPVRLSVGRDSTPVEALAEVRKRIRAIPRNGLGYGLLRYLSEDPNTRARLSAGRSTAVNFNYLGQFDQVLDSAPFRMASDSITAGPVSGSRRYKIRVLAGVLKGRLQLSFEYSSELHSESTIRRLAEATAAGVRELVLALRQTPPTSVDLSTARLDEEDLNLLFQELGTDEGARV